MTQLKSSTLEASYPTAVTEIAKACHILDAQVEDAYPCTPQQIQQISEDRCEVFHLILSFGPNGDLERWIRSVQKVVSMNSILRTRIVCHQSKFLQIVTTEEHTTEYLTGDVEQFLNDEKAFEMNLGTPLFRTAVIGRRFVATIHHAVMDYWSLNSFLRGDAAMLYLGQEPIHRAAFKDFVNLCAGIDRAKADSFWAARFRGSASIYPPMPASAIARPSEKLEKTITLNLMSRGIEESHIAWYAEAAWALTIATYADNESIAYGIVMSGRSSMLGDAGNTLGPTTVELPVLITVQPSMTVDALVKGRATALRELKSNPLFLQYSLENIAATNNTARIASKFQSLFNIVPPQPISLPTTEEESKSVSLERVIKRSHGGFALTFLCRLVDESIILEALYDPAVLDRDHVDRILNQFEHDLRTLIEVPADTRLGDLQRLSPQDRDDLIRWHTLSHETDNSRFHALRGFDVCPSNQTWIVAPKNIDQLVPVGSIGELLVEMTPSTRDLSTQASHLSPRWLENFRPSGTTLRRTGELGKYSQDGSLVYIGKRENRIKLGSRIVQLEAIEETIRSCNQVKDIVVVSKIISGRTRLVAVVTLKGIEAAAKDPWQLQVLPAALISTTNDCLHVVRQNAEMSLELNDVPVVWHVVSSLPRIKGRDIDREAVRLWLKDVK
ncbi:CoA-dependent acyltransferase [Aureobasidium pullulans]|nr:CoA-dependent acyltransferase [Aureobasidium pullulans]